MIVLTESAAAELRRLLAARDLEDGLVRFAVEAGGCAGLRYAMDFAGEPEPTDVVSEQHGMRVACEAGALRWLEGLTVDYARGPLGGGFRFDNPGAGPACGCGSSFRA